MTFIQVLPDVFKTRPTFHALFHLSYQARLYGTLRNLSVSSKEMVHRIHKATVTSTNKQVLQRDLTAQESLMQGLRFLIEKSLHDNSDLGQLFETGLLDGVYFEHKKDLCAALDRSDEDDSKVTPQTDNQGNGSFFYSHLEFFVINYAICRCIS
jgi:hypothetical protein